MPRVVRVFPASALCGAKLPRLGSPGAADPLLARHVASPARVFGMDPVDMAAILRSEAQRAYDPIFVDPSTLMHQ